MHLIEAAIRSSDIRKIEVIYDDPETEMTVKIEQNGCQVTVKWFKQLVASGRLTNDEKLSAVIAWVYIIM